MVEYLRKLKLLLYKNFLVRKRHWLVSIIGEIILPVGIIASIWATRNYTVGTPEDVKNESRFEMKSIDDLIDKVTLNGNLSIPLFFAPNNDFTRKLMDGVDDCFKHSINKTGYASEAEVIRTFYEDNKGNLSSYSSKLVVLIFDEESANDASKHLKYKFRSVGLWNKDLFDTFGWGNYEYDYTYGNIFTQSQTCVDKTFIKMKSNKPDYNPKIHIQRFPYPPYTKYNNNDGTFRQLFGALLISAFMIPLFIETARASSEKFLGINVLMSMNGVSNALNLFSWIINGFVFLSVVCVLPILGIMLLSTGEALPFIHFGNPFIVWLVLTVYIAHLLTFGIHVSAYFSRSLLVMFALLILNVLSMVFRLYILNEDTFWLMPYIGILFPNVMLYRAIDEINYYEMISEGVHWNNSFQVGTSSYKIGGSIGMILILSIIGIVLHFSLAVYIYAINPGKYGTKKHPLYFLQYFKRESKQSYESEMENIEYNGMDGKPFEPAPDVFQAGIQIRNLKKSYTSGLINKTEVHALKGVSIDFYKGQITSLLGHNGAGKTTMMSILTGMMSPSEGLVLVNSKNLKEHSTEIMNDMGLCTQDNMLFPSLTVGEQLEFFAMLKGKGKEKSEIKKNVKDFLEKLKMSDKTNSLPKTLSGGQKRRVCLGMALVGDSSTLILDEPTSGLDPESRRVIWNVLLKMRGQKTILISTHDMEEADILGDRIAVLHTGNLKSYGTSMFLKKLLGQSNIEVALSIEPWCDTERVRYELHHEGQIINQDGSKIVISIPNSPDIPDALDNIEIKKKDLGISGLSVSFITLEQVFLKLTKEDSDISKLNQHAMNRTRKLTGTELFMQNLRALFYKKFTYTLKNLSTIVMTLLLSFLALLSISLILKQINDAVEPQQKLIPLNLDLYSKPVTYYKSDDPEFANKYKLVTENSHGEAIETKESNIENGLLNYAKQSLNYYDNHLLAAAQLNKTENGISANALFSNKASFSLPITVNLLFNALIKSIVGDDYSISISSQQLPVLNAYSADPSLINAISTAVIFLFFFSPAMALFVLHPLRESSAGVKQLQIMSGVSGFTYWGTMFIFDLLICIVLIGVVTMGFIVMDYCLGLGIYHQTEILLTILSLMLFVINTLSIAYIFSFINAKTSTVMRLLTYIPLGCVTLEIVMYAVNALLSSYKAVQIIRPIQKGIMLFIPYVSFFHNQISFHITAQSNARCRKLPNEFYDSRCAQTIDTCCALGCYNGECKVYLKYFNNFKSDTSLEESYIYLGVTPILLFGIMIVLEYQLIQKLRVKLKKLELPDYPVDEQVKNEKLSIFQKILTLNGTHPIEDNSTKNGRTSISFNDNMDNRVFLAYELRKQYGELMAVKDVSFGVNKRECFGLLGVNGAGKSTTFRMMTGGEVPDSGIMYLGDKDILNHRQYFLSQMGYCPQQHAIVRSLNSYDHLRLFARIRGIPEDQVEEEVQTWILRLNLTACASQPSGTYSGGNKRRLNIAIALIGNPNLVLMDEPTTGVDPGARRSLWNVIQSCQKAGQAVILTSHSMEECEALCNRLAIMVGGRLVCIGPSQELKQRFGAGYNIQIKLNPEKAVDQVVGIKNDMAQSLNCEVADEDLSHLVYRVKPTDTTWRKMYNVMNSMKDKYNCIDDFFVQSSTLEQLFLLFARGASNNT